MIIALSGYAGSGKDTVADVLVEERGFVKYAWADTLRMAAAALDPIVAVDEHGAVYRYTEVLDEVGYVQAKVQFPEVRLVLQRLGTEVGRNLIGDNVWIDATFARIEREHSLSSNIVIADTRFPNEAEAVRNLSGDNLVVRVTRPGVDAESDHPSEISLDGYDFDSYFSNEGDMDWLTKAVLAWSDSLEIPA